MRGRVSMAENETVKGIDSGRESDSERQSGSKR